MPGGTDKALAVRMQEAVSRIVLEPESRKALLAQGLDAVGSSQEQFTKDYLAEMARWSKVVKAVGV
jgi:tripartite-type tricarboxylate transporter receptor subunit TctC